MILREHASEDNMHAWHTFAACAGLVCPRCMFTRLSTKLAAVPDFGICLRLAAPLVFISGGQRRPTCENWMLPSSACLHGFVWKKQVHRMLLEECM